ncbi:dihydropteroate synthase [Ferruginibacter sp. SUN106]|uniref:dihydropteroate synthase n=1 Tax=Ferruginibacter sp. SUN106 TaxID=2978348 RepID=UPI003D363E9D
MFTLNCKGKLLMLDSPVVMGIINATPDSFYKGNINEDMIVLAAKMLADGATILDIGGQSTKPGSERITAEEELNRVIPVIEAISKKFPGAIISIDTYSSTVAHAAVEAGAAIVNDVSAGNMDIQMLPTVAGLGVPYVCMHMQGTPESMQKDPQYSDVTREVLDFFIAKIHQCKKEGIADIIIDPGFGFGKTTAHNFALLKKMSVLRQLNLPILAGISRKGTIYKTLGITAADALNGTTALNTIALMNGASILRVHDVKEAMQAITLFNAYKKAP